MDLDDTIAAIATPIAPSGLGVIRISGTNSISLVEGIFKGNSIKKAESHKLIFGYILDKGKLLDEVLVVVMRAPKSFTAEDVVEIHTHGSPFVIRKILELLLKKGARLANPGEFTQRAFFNGRLDLTQAEAISDLIHANSEIGANIALDQMNGKLFHAINDIKSKIIDIASQIEANIEFPDEVNEINLKEDCFLRLNQVSSDIKKLIYNAEFGKKIREGFSITIIGRPNVGKSSLLNLLLREQRAIVTEIPGTTRDSIEECILIRGIPFRLTDTAGIRKTDNKIESEGIRRTQIAREKADFVLLVLDASQKLNEEDLILINELEKNKSLIVVNKKDLIKTTQSFGYQSTNGIEHILVSAKCGYGLSELESLLYKKATLGMKYNQDDIWITNQRQFQAVKKAFHFLKSAIKVLYATKGEEFMAADLRSCLNALGEVVGETTADDLLEQIFSEFCIGK